ncbi:protein ANKUB1-like [Leuresthes tenuis]|uniref:protein ANKUB1-like n=1 Tax=Leuresthes tenuis TaxID=355514 RepID=UPI003B50B5E1
MRVFLCYEGFSERFDVSPDQTVGALRQMAKDIFLVQISNDGYIRQYLELNYSGAALQDDWTLRDLGITSRSTIHCSIKSETRPVIHVFNAVTGETLPIIGNQCLLHTSVAKLKTIVSEQSGLPVSAFRLSTPAGVQLYDCNWLKDYGIEMGTTLCLDTWDGWVEFLQGCVRGSRQTVQSNLSAEKPIIRFQLQVALYVAASSGHLDLASWLLKMGVPAEEPVGVHPYRQWCQQSDHQDANKCPIHVAAENSRLLILKLFVTKNLYNLACRNPAGCDPLKIAIKHGHRECARYLANKLCSVVSVLDASLPMRIYLQIKHWVSLGKKRASSGWRHYTSEALKAKLGNKLLIDGFNQPGSFSKSRKFETKSRCVDW